MSVLPVSAGKALQQASLAAAVTNIRPTQNLRSLLVAKHMEAAAGKELGHPRGYPPRE